MEEWERQLNEARIRLQGDAQQYEQGKALLGQVLAEAVGTVWGQRAQEMLSEVETPRPTPPDEEMRRWQLELASFVGLLDHRLPDFLRRLQAQPTRSVQLQPQVSSSVRRWLGALLPRVQTGLTPEEQLQLRQFSAAAQGLAACEELPEFGRLRRVLFQWQFEQTSAQVADALRRWALDEAWQALDALDPAPAGCRPELERLQAEIYQVAQLQQAVQELLRQLPADNAALLTVGSAAAPAASEPEPQAELGTRPEAGPETKPEVELDSWLDARLLSESLQKLQPYLVLERVPESWRARLTRAGGQGRTALQFFLQAQAQAALTLAGLREFQTEFQRLAPVLEQPREWFDPALAGLLRQVAQEAERAAGAEDLTALSSHWRQQAGGLPPAVAQVLNELVEELSQITSVWKALRSGEPFTGAPTQQLPVPLAMQGEMAKYGVWLSDMQAAFERLKTAVPLAGPELYQEELELAAEILAQAPEHRLARKLYSEAGRRRADYQLDAALAYWNIGEFKRLLESSGQNGLYARLAESTAELEQLADLARQPALATWQAAAVWWAHWRKANRQLAVARPDALQQALLEQEKLRRQQWYDALGALLVVEAPPQEYDEAAATLADEADDARMQAFRRSLLQRATTGRVGLYLRKQALEAAEEELRKLPPEQTETDQLRMQLALARARQAGGNALAELLWREWYKVQLFVREPYAVLLEALQHAWEMEDARALEKVRQILARVRASHDEAAEGALAELAEWERWLALEQQLLAQSAPRQLRDLRDWLRARATLPPELLQRRLEKLLRHWQRTGNTLLLAWAYQAFQPHAPALLPPADPTEQLRAESDRVAERVRQTLAQQPELTLTELQALRADLRNEEHRWRDLQDYLRLLPHTVRRVQYSTSFERTRATLEQALQLATEITRLQSADLRAESERVGTLRYQLRQLEDVALRAPLQQTLDRLAPLATLGFLELRLREAAEACGSADPRDVLALGYFDRLAQTLEHLMRQFTAAGAEGGAMWGLVTVEYETWVWQTARLLLPRPAAPELYRLVGLLRELEAEDAAFERALGQLLNSDTRPSVPAGGPFDPTQHMAYLDLLPRHAPRSRKTWLRFDRGAHTEPLWTILDRSRPHLPAWVRDYLNEGIPACASER